MPTNNRRKNPFTLAPALTFVVLALFIVFGFFDVKNHVAMAILTVIVFFGVFIAYLFCRGNLLLRIPNKKISGEGVWLAFFGAVLMILLSSLWKFGVLRSGADTLSPLPNSFGQGIFMAITLALVPAVCEEYFFRGIVMLEYRFAGVFGAVLFSALLFAVAHLSLAMFPMYFFSGIVLALVVFVTGDVKVAVFSHFVYNLFMLFAERRVYLLALDGESRVLFILLFGVLFFLALFAFFRIAALCLRARAEDEPPIRVPKGKGFWVFTDIISAPSLWLVLVCFLVFAILDIFL